MKKKKDYDLILVALVLIIIFALVLSIFFYYSFATQKFGTTGHVVLRENKTDNLFLENTPLENVKENIPQMLEDKTP